MTTMSKFKALKFYFGALFQASGVTHSEYKPSIQEIKFADFAVRHSTAVVECGPRLDTDLVEIANSEQVHITLFEASPVFAWKLKKKIQASAVAKNRVRLVNIAVSSHSGSLRYYFLNQSFVKNVPFRSYGLSKKVLVTSLDDFFIKKNRQYFIKTDVEGLDLKVFQGAKELLKTTKYFQLEMCSLQRVDYLQHFSDFDLFLLLSENHPLRRGQGASTFTPIDKFGWETVFDSMRQGETNVLCGVRKGAAVPNF